MALGLRFPQLLSSSWSLAVGGGGGITGGSRLRLISPELRWRHTPPSILVLIPRFPVCSAIKPPAAPGLQPAAALKH